MPTTIEGIEETAQASAKILHAHPQAKDSGSLANKIAFKVPHCVLGVLVLYALVRSICAAFAKPLWFDELCTLVMVQQQRVSSLWAALQQGADSQPLPFYLVERVMRALIANENLALRGVSILAFACAFVFIFLVNHKRCGNLNSLICAAILFSTVLFDIYAVEARGYSLVMACVAFALICYQKVPAFPWTILLATSLLAAELFHYYAVFAFLPFLMAETALFLEGRRPRISVWLALLCGFVPFVLSWPMLLRIKSFYGENVWAKPNIQEALSHFGWFFHGSSEKGLLLVALAAIAVLGTMLISERRSKAGEARAAGPQLHQGVLTLGFLAMPFVVFAITKITHGVMSGRHTLAAILGFPLAAGYALSAMRKQYVMISLLFGAIVLAAVVPGERQFWTSYKWNCTSPAKSAEELASAAGHPELPIVVSDQLEYLQLAHYASPEWKERFVSLVDPPQAVKYLGHDTLDRNILILRKWAPLHVCDFSSFAAQHSTFLLYSNRGGLATDWWPGRLKKDGYSLKPVSVRPKETHDYFHRVILVSQPTNHRTP